MAKHDQTSQTETEIEKPETDNVSGGTEVSTKSSGSTPLVEGVRARRGLMLKQLIPDQDWIMRNVVSKGKGTRATVGRIFGVATATQRKQNVVQDKVIESVAVIGIFNAESYVTGELSEGSSCYFPMAYAEKMETLFLADPTIKVIEVDCDIGIEATGKTIPYEWVTTAYREGEEMAVLRNLRKSRGRPENLLASAEGVPLQLTAPGK